MMDSLVRVLKKGGPEALVEKCVPAIPERLKLTAFCNAVDIVLSDGEVEDDEEELIEKLKNALDVEEDDCKKIIKVMMIKNRG
jgi:hypothetical protein